MLTERLLPHEREVMPKAPSWGEKDLDLRTAGTSGNGQRLSASSPQLCHHLCPSDSRRQQRTDRERAEVSSGKGKNDAALASDSETEPQPSAAAVRQQLAMILQSKTFIQSEKLSRFLRFVVQHVIDGNPECLKEYLVGVEVYDRKPPYDPSQDSIVRTEARRLRNKLKEYYGAEGKEDPIFIYLRPGSYIPAFQSREDLAGGPGSAGPGALLLKESCSIVTAILPFTDISGNPISRAYALGVPDELAYALMRKDCCTVVSPFSTACLAPQGLELAATMRKVGAKIAFEGSARVEGTKLRVTARIVDVAGVQLWVSRIDIELGTQTSFAVEESIASALSEGFNVVRTSERSVLSPR